MKHLMKKAVKAAVFAALTTLALTAFASAEGEMAIGAGCTTGTSLRMRSEPNTSSAIVTTLNKSVAVALLDDSVPGWYKINYNGSTGYVSSDYLILDQDNIFTTYGRVPEGTVNFAFLGQFAETARDTIFTTEYSMRTGMEAVYTLLNIDRGVPEVWGSTYDVRALIDATVKLRDGKKITDMDLPLIPRLAMKEALKKIEGTDLEKFLKEYNAI